jgi:hypothetical protein
VRKGVLFSKSRKTPHDKPKIEKSKEDKKRLLFRKIRSRERDSIMD